jgi:RNA-directed DNA polymerase
LIQRWVEQRVRRHLARNSKRRGFGWKRWGRRWLYGHLGIFDEYRVRYTQPRQTALPV